MTQHKKAIVLSGPSGIGKSSLLRKIVRRGMAEPMDDGFILVYRANNHYYVLQSGLYPVSRTISVLAKWLRILCRYQSPYLNIQLRHSTVKTIRRGEMIQNLAVFIGSMVTKNRSSEIAMSNPVRLAKLFLVIHPNDNNPPRRLNGESIESVNAADAGKIFTNYTACDVIHSHEQAMRRIIRDKILTELRG